MSLWRLEWLRLVRSRRLVVLVGVYVFFGLLGPLGAAYLPEILARFGGDMVVTVPDPVPADGMAQFASNANQIGLLVAVVVISGSLVLDAIPEMSVFLRTRISPVRRLLWPRLVVSGAALVTAVVAGTLVAWYETAVLIGAVPPGALALGTLATVLYMVFVTGLVAAVGVRSGSILVTSATTIGALLVLPLIGLVRPVGRWLPSHLLGATDGLVRSTETWTGYLPAAVTTLALTAALVAIALSSVGRREL